MDSSRRSFKALSQAQPIKKDIDETLNKLQMEKRKYLALQREQTYLKDELQKVKKELNQAKLIEPKTRLYSNKNVQKQLSIQSNDRSYQNVLNRIVNSKTQIDLERRQVLKYKGLAKDVQNDINRLIAENQAMESKIVKKHEEIQTIKDNLYEFRTQNMRNTNQFKNSFQALHRSSVKEQNQRKKSGALKKSFLGEELKNSMAINLKDYNQQEEGAGQKKQQFMTDSVPLVKERVKSIIHSNKEKLKISDNYRKFGEGLENMFKIMQQYKGRDDIDFIADQFVIKQKQVKKIQQYIGKLQNRMANYQKQLNQIKDFDKMLQNDIKSKKEHPSQEKCVQMQQSMKQTIQQYSQQENQMTIWLNKISQILKPLLGQDLGRTNAINLIGDLQDVIQVNQQINNKRSPSKSNGPNSQGVIDFDVKGFHNQLLSYQKMKQIAQQYINNRKN